MIGLFGAGYFLVEIVVLAYQNSRFMAFYFLDISSFTLRNEWKLIKVEVRFYEPIKIGYCIVIITLPSAIQVPNCA